MAGRQFCCALGNVSLTFHMSYIRICFQSDSCLIIWLLVLKHVYYSFVFGSVLLPLLYINLGFFLLPIIAIVVIGVATVIVDIKFARLPCYFSDFCWIWGSILEGFGVHFVVFWWPFGSYVLNLFAEAFVLIRFGSGWAGGIMRTFKNVCFIMLWGPTAPANVLFSKIRSVRQRFQDLPSNVRLHKT